MKELIKNFIEENAVDEGFLQDWYQCSVDDRDNPVWTDEHIAEVCGDFYLIPKESVEKLSDNAEKFKVNDANDFRAAIIGVAKYMAFFNQEVCAFREPIDVEWGLEKTFGYEGIRQVIPTIALVNRTEY